MGKTIKQTFNEIVKFQAQSPEQNRSGCLYEQDAAGEILRGYSIDNEVFKKCNFYTARLISCVFVNCTFLNCNFSSTEFINCKFINCTINNSDFTNAILTDTQFKDCATANNILNHLHCSGLTKGLTAKDENITKDNIVEEQETAMEKDLKTVFKSKIIKIMTDNFPNWKIEDNGEDQYPSFVCTDENNTIGLALYADPEKNSTDTDNFWWLSVFYKEDAILSNDFNFFGQEAENIVSIINDWKQDVIENNASRILSTIFEDLDK